MLAVGALVCAGMVIYEAYLSFKNEMIYENLRDEGADEAQESQQDFSNPDQVGWISIEGTSIDYPVMQSEQEDYYLNHDYYGNVSSFGVPYIPSGCCLESGDARSDNVIIYGHHISGGRMFSALEKYKSESFYKNHRYINLKTRTEDEVYEIFAAFKTTVYDDEGFKYYEFIDDDGSGEKFYEYVEEAILISLYETGIIPVYGDKLLALSTCEYSSKNGRLVVAARRISAQDS